MRGTYCKSARNNPERSIEAGMEKILAKMEKVRVEKKVVKMEKIIVLIRQLSTFPRRRIPAFIPHGIKAS